MAETVRQLTEAEKGFEMQSLEVDSSLSADDLQSGKNIEKELNIVQFGNYLTRKIGGLPKSLFG